jgi:hypothetical protein
MLTLLGQGLKAREDHEGITAEREATDTDWIGVLGHAGLRPS